MKPTICPFCGSRILLVPSSTLKPGQPGWIYLCNRFPDCDARVRCHPGTITPMGTLADANLRRWRTTAHQQFDQLWRSGKIPSRTQAYGWLAEIMQVPQSAAHFGLFDQQQCQQAIDASANFKGNFSGLQNYHQS